MYYISCTLEDPPLEKGVPRSEARGGGFLVIHLTPSLVG